MFDCGRRPDFSGYIVYSISYVLIRKNEEYILALSDEIK